MNNTDLALVLRAISENTDFRLAFSVVADEIVDKVYSYHKNPNCTCRGNIVNWINSNTPKVEELINRFKSLFENLKQTPAVAPAPQVNAAAQPALKETVPAPAPAPVPSTVVKIGTYEVIDRTPQAYAAIFDKIKQERWVFRGLNIVPSVQDGKEVWFVFFY